MGDSTFYFRARVVCSSSSEGVRSQFTAKKRCVAKLETARKLNSIVEWSLRMKVGRVALCHTSLELTPQDEGLVLCVQD